MNVCYLLVVSAFAGLVISVGEANGQNQSKYVNQNEVQIILGYCYQHADRPNPVQDLIDKGLVSADFAGDTCASIKKFNDVQQTILTETTKANQAYTDCYFDKTMTLVDCWNIIRDYCHNPVYARFINNCP